MPLFHTKISKLCRFSNVKTVFFAVFPISFSWNQDSRRGMSRIGPPSFQLGVYRRPPLSRGSEFSTRRIEESASPRREFICPGCNPGPPIGDTPYSQIPFLWCGDSIDGEGQNGITWIFDAISFSGVVIWRLNGNRGCGNDGCYCCLWTDILLILRRRRWDGILRIWDSEILRFWDEDRSAYGDAWDAWGIF